MGEIFDLIKNISVKQIFMNEGHDNKVERKLKTNAHRYHIQIVLVSSKKVYISKIVFNFLNKIHTNNENEDSLIVYTKLNGYHILFMGDANKENEKR